MTPPRFGLLLGLALAFILGGNAQASDYSPGDEGHGVAGIGIVAASDGAGGSSQMRDHIVVRQVITGGPASKAGIKAGDEIVEIDGARMAGKGFHDAVAHLLRGPLGSVVKITIVRPGEAQHLVFDLVRDVVPEPKKQ
jgi:C-terminal processing protease CtpA/Prc